MTMKISGTSGLLQNYDYQTPTTGFSYTFTTANFVVLNPAGTLATGTIVTPASPDDGMTITVVSTQSISALTFSANTGQSIAGAATTLVANQAVSYVYRLTNATWYPAGGVGISYGGPRAQLFTTPGAGQTFTIPPGTTQLKVTVVSGGGGSGGAPATCTNASGQAGGAGSMGVSWLTGLSPGNTISVTVGAAGTAGSSAGGSGGAGGTSSVSSGTQTITTITATGGNGGAGNSSAATASSGICTGAQINVRSIGALSTTSGGLSPFLPTSGYATGGNGVSTTSAGVAGNVGRQGIVIFEY